VNEVPAVREPHLRPCRSAGDGRWPTKVTRQRTRLDLPSFLCVLWSGARRSLQRLLTVTPKAAAFRQPVGDIPTIPGELFANFQTSFYVDPVDAVFKALAVQ